MKKYFALLIVVLLLSIGYFFSLRVAMPKENVSGYFAIFNTIIDQSYYDSFKYIAADPDDFPEEDHLKFSFLMKNYCRKNNCKFLFMSYSELEEEGYIVDGGFSQGILFGFDYLTIDEESMVGRAYFYKGNLSSYRREFSATLENKKWVVTLTNQITVS